MMGKKRLLLAAISLCAVAALAACSPQQAPTGGESDDGGAPAVEAVAWSADSDCASCHAEESAAAADAATGSGFHAGQGVTCATCHADEAMGEVHADYATARPPSELRKTEVQPETCLTSGCHDQAQLKEKTAAATVLTDNNGMTVNPPRSARQRGSRIGDLRHVPRDARKRPGGGGGAPEVPWMPPQGHLRVRLVPRRRIASRAACRERRAARPCTMTMNGT